MIYFYTYFNPTTSNYYQKINVVSDEAGFVNFDSILFLLTLLASNLGVSRVK